MVSQGGRGLREPENYERPFSTTSEWTRGLEARNTRQQVSMSITGSQFTDNVKQKNKYAKTWKGEQRSHDYRELSNGGSAARRQHYDVRRSDDRSSFKAY